MTRLFNSSRPAHCVSPRPSRGTDADRQRHYGPLQPMHDDAHPATLGLLFVFFLLFGAATALAIWGFLA